VLTMEISSKLLIIELYCIVLYLSAKLTRYTKNIKKYHMKHQVNGQQAVSAATNVLY